MPGQRTKFSEVWLTAKDCNGDTVSDWCKKGKDDFHGYCCVCKIDLKCDNGGKVQLLKHCSKPETPGSNAAYKGHQTNKADIQ